MHLSPESINVSSILSEDAPIGASSGFTYPTLFSIGLLSVAVHAVMVALFLTIELYKTPDVHSPQKTLSFNLSTPDNRVNNVNTLEGKPSSKPAEETITKSSEPITEQPDTKTISQPPKPFQTEKIVEPPINTLASAKEKKPPKKAETIPPLEETLNQPITPNVLDEVIEPDTETDKETEKGKEIIDSADAFASQQSAPQTTDPKNDSPSKSAIDNGSSKELKEAALVTETDASNKPKAEQLEIESLIHEYAAYPKLAEKRGIEGIVHLVLTFDAKGVLKDVEIGKSSGSKLLDKAALRSAKKSLKGKTEPTLAEQSFEVKVQYILS